MENDTQSPEPTSNNDSSNTEQTEQKPIDKPILTTSVSPDFKLPVDNTSNKRKTIIIIASSVVAVLVIFAGVMFALLKLNEQTQTAAVDTTPVAQTTVTKTFNGATAASTVDSIKANVKSTLLKQSSDTDKTDYYVSAYKINDAKFAVKPKQHKGIAGTGTVETVNTDYDATVKTLEDNKFKTLSKDTDKDAIPGRTDKYTLLASDTVVCYANSSIQDEKTKLAKFSLGCADMSEYKTAVEDLQPFYDAMANSKVKDTPKVAGVDGLVLSNLDIGDGAEGYKNAEIAVGNLYSVGGYGASFYKAPNGVWTFAFAGQEVQLCSALNTPDLQKGLTGRNCNDEATGKIIKYTMPAADSSKKTS